jgi:hypothetical protein
MTRSKEKFRATETLPVSDEPASVEEAGFTGPSPNPKTNLILADIALRGGAMLVRQGLERGLLGKRYAPDKARQILKGRTIGESIAGSAAARLALGSVPGAIIVGGGLLAKTLYDLRKGKTAKRKGEAKIAGMAAKGEASES